MLIFLSLTVHLSQVRAIDLDGPPNNFIIYSIVSGDPKQQFSIDPHTGHITVRSMLDREVVSFTSPPRTRTHLFYQGFSCICWILWSHANILITAVHIWLMNVIEHWCHEVHIFIILLTRPLAFQITHYSLTVQAADEGDPPLSSAVQVTVTVSDVNDNPPMFSQINHSLILQVKTNASSKPTFVPPRQVSQCTFFRQTASDATVISRLTI